jgi:hypothetical protein
MLFIAGLSHLSEERVYSSPCCDSKPLVCLIYTQPLHFIHTEDHVYSFGLYRADPVEAIIHQQFTCCLSLYFKAVFGLRNKLDPFGGFFFTGIWPCWAVGDFELTI